MRQVCFGIDIGGTTVKLGLVNREGDLLEKREFSTQREADRASSHFMFQMFWAYSSTARSAEKKPALAMFTRDILLNRALSP